MARAVIVARDVAKRYRIGSTPAYRTLRESLVDGIRAAFRRGGGGGGQQESVWALDGVSFEVTEGEVVGIIGRNGAGKSTLLKILSRITEPTRGEVLLRGRVGALLEVGTGFHPELTGRENVYLSGSILGMRRGEITAKFDEIVDFAGIGRFLDTPVKRYSSGMFMRLAFAVAAHLEPEILIIDEVLSVGDASFQRKCLNKMDELGRGGRTVLFVSHNLPAVTRICPRVILLDAGRVLQDGPADKIVGAYLRTGLGTAAVRVWPDPATAPGNTTVRLLGARLRDDEGRVAATFDIRRSIGIELEFLVLEDGHQLIPSVGVFNEEGLNVFAAAEVKSPWYLKPRPRGRYRTTAWIPGNFMAEGMYFVAASLGRWNPAEHFAYEQDAVAFQVIDTLDGDSARGDYGGSFPGIVRPLLNWTTRYEPADI
jgi:lipopolysaccharide transport system ATP-binding protein